RFRTLEPWVPQHLPQVPVEVAEVAGVDAPWTIVGPVGERRAGVLGAGEQCLDLRPIGNRVADAELAAVRLTDGNVGVLRELGTRVELRSSPAPSLNIAAAPAGVRSSPGYSVPTSPADSRPRPSR